MDAIINPHSFVAVLFGLIAAHFICDYVFQPFAMFKGKNHLASKLDDTAPNINWWYWLTAHSAMHGVAVYIVTRNLYLDLAETTAHWLIDWGHNAGKYSLHAEQAMHLACKLLWALIVLVIFVTSF